MIAVTMPTKATTDDDSARGRRIQLLRERAGLTQIKVAHRLGVDTSSVSRWERGQGLRAPAAAKLARLLGTTTEFIMSGGHEMGDTEPPYAAWGEFLKWLDTAPDRALVEPWMLDNLRHVRGRPGLEPTLESYQRMMFALLTWEGERAGTDGDPGSGGGVRGR